MKQVWITKSGAPRILRAQDALHLDLGPEKGRIQTNYASKNFADLIARMKIYPNAQPLPSLVGCDITGQIDRVSDSNGPFRKGGRVFFADEIRRIFKRGLRLGFPCCGITSQC